jgi:hypothetical protein
MEMEMEMFNMRQIIYIDGGEDIQMRNRMSQDSAINYLKIDMLKIFLQTLLDGNKKNPYEPMFVTLFLPYIETPAIRTMIDQIIQRSPMIEFDVNDNATGWNVKTILDKYKKGLDTFMYVYGHGTLAGEPNIFNEVLMPKDVEKLIQPHIKILYVTSTCYARNSGLKTLTRTNKNFFYLAFDKYGKKCGAVQVINEWIKPIFNRVCWSGGLFQELGINAENIYNDVKFEKDDNGFPIRPLYDAPPPSDDEDAIEEAVEKHSEEKEQEYKYPSEDDTNEESDTSDNGSGIYKKNIIKNKSNKTNKKNKSNKTNKKIKRKASKKIKRKTSKRKTSKRKTSKRKTSKKNTN